MITLETKYVVYLIESGYAVRKNAAAAFDRAFYNSKGPAPRLANRLNDRSGYEHDIVAVCTVEEYTNGICPDYENGEVKLVERTNLMTGKKYMEPANTPLYCSPSSETYWSM